MNLDLSRISKAVRLRLETPMNDEDLMRFSEENHPFRIEREPNGENLIMTPAEGKTGSINRRILHALGVWADEDGGGEVFDSSTGFRLPNGAVRSPYASEVSNRRWNSLSEMDQRKFTSLCPEFVVEIASPSVRIQGCEEEWIAQGPKLAWLVDPQARRVTIHRPGQDPEAFEDPTSVQGTGCVAGFELVMERVWGSGQRK